MEVDFGYPNAFIGKNIHNSIVNYILYVEIEEFLKFSKINIAFFTKIY